MLYDTIILDNDKRDFLVWREGSGNTLEIYDIQVGSERGKGKGRRMVNTLITILPPGVKLVWALTRPGNLIAQEFYEALGFRVVAVLRNFYKDRVDGKNMADAIMYGLDIPEEDT